MTAAVYYRVSSKGQDFATQKDAVGRVAPADAEPYEEKASAKTTDREALTRLLADVRMGRISAVYVFKLDRLTRSGVADTFRVVEEIRNAGCTLYCVADNLVIRPGHDDVASDVMIFALGLAAKLERTAKNDRIAAARARLEKKGEAWGRPKGMTPAEVAKAIDMKRAGKTVLQIAAALGHPKSVVGRAVKGVTA